MKAAQICRDAAELVSGQRAKTHGDKLRNHQNIASLWNAYFSIRRDPASALNAGDVATMMALLKIARMELGDANIGDSVDGAAYLGIRGELDSQ